MSHSEKSQYHRVRDTIQNLWISIKDEIPPEDDIDVLIFIPKHCVTNVVPSWIARIDAERLLEMKKTESKDEIEKRFSWDRIFSHWLPISILPKYILKKQELKRKANEQYTKEIEKANIKIPKKYLDTFWEDEQLSKAETKRRRRRRRRR